MEIKITKEQEDMWRVWIDNEDIIRIVKVIKNEL